MPRRSKQLRRADQRVRASGPDRARPPPSLHRLGGARPSSLELAAKAIPIFEELERRSRARAHLASRRLHRAAAKGGSPTGRRRSSARSSTTAARAGRHRDASPTSPPRSSTGPLRVPEALDRCEELLEEATDRVGEGERARLHGRARGARRPVRRGRRLVAEAASDLRGDSERRMRARTTAGRVLGRIEMLAGDRRGGRGRPPECCATFERVHDEAGLSTVAAELADALYAQGRYDEAASWLELAREASARRRHQRSVDVATGRPSCSPAPVLSARPRRSPRSRALAARTDALSDTGLSSSILRRCCASPETGEAGSPCVDEASGCSSARAIVVSARRLRRPMLSELTRRLAANTRRAPIGALRACPADGCAVRGRRSPGKFAIAGRGDDAADEG